MLILNSQHISAGRGEKLLGEIWKRGKERKTCLKTGRGMSGNRWSVLTSDSYGIVGEQRVALFISAGVDTRVVVRDVVDVQLLVV